MSNKELISRFETGGVPPEAFHHADHVRLGFAYLSEYSPLLALEKFSAAIRQFAASVGKPDRYNETITFAYLFLIREKMALCSDANWDEFAQKNPELLVWKNGMLDRYYRPETLKSEFARNVFVLPDRSL
jgi:hypothetical protein